MNLHPFLETFDFFPPSPRKGRWVVAVSGGADSTALLCLLAEHPLWGPTRLIAAHVNYGLRGEASDGDEAFVRALCAQRRIPLKVLKVRRIPPSLQSIQDWARRLRYAFFDRVVRKNRAVGVVVAHHLDDQAETVLDRMLRGSGLRGLGALRPSTALPVGKGRLLLWRPLLSLRRKDLETYLRETGQTWRTDASNQKGLYRRNRLRHDVLPCLKAFNPRLEEALAHLAETSSAEDAFLDSLASRTLPALGTRKKIGRVDWKASKFSRLDVALQRRVLRLLAEGLNPDARGLTFDRLEDARLVFLGVLKGPRDLGAGLSACRIGSWAGFRCFKPARRMAPKRLRRVQ